MYCDRILTYNMLRLIILSAVFSLSAASPAVTRTREEIEAYKQFLDEIRKGNEGIEEFEAKRRLMPLANDEELSGKYQGDIELDDEDYELMLEAYALGRNAYTSPTITTWPDNTVIFQFGEEEFDDEQKAAIWDAAKDIESKTCVKFRYRIESDDVFVNLTGTAGGCSAHIGYRPSRGAHKMNLARNTVGVGCFRHATIVHEFMHILGFRHMHATHDRDEYVKIHEENIRPTSINNFNKHDETKVDNLGLEYDYVSCLHYSPFAFSANGEPTIEALKEHEGDMGQRIYVTDKDWLRINRHYNCPGAWD